MTNPSHEGDSQISRVHSMAICREIGDRLGTSLLQKPVRMSPHLIALMKRLRDGPDRIRREPKR
jgi:hypothetical protein